MELFGLPARLQLVLLRVRNSRCPLWRADSASSIKQHECGRATTFVSPFIILTNFHTLFNKISLWCMHEIKLFRFLAGILSARAQNRRILKRNRIASAILCRLVRYSPLCNHEQLSPLENEYLLLLFDSWQGRT